MMVRASASCGSLQLALGARRRFKAPGELLGLTRESELQVSVTEHQERAMGSQHGRLGLGHSVKPSIFGSRSVQAGVGRRYDEPVQARFDNRAGAGRTGMSLQTGRLLGRLIWRPFRGETEWCGLEGASV